MSCVLTIDEGTTSTRALLIDESGKILDIVQEEITQYYPQPGWVEHDAEEIWLKTLNCCRELVKRNLEQAKEISSIAITNQRETTVVWDAKTGQPIHKAIVWQCRRTTERCEELSQEDIGGINFTEYIKAKTGLIPDAYFSGTKLEWILNHCHPEGAKRPSGSHPDLLFVTLPSY